MNNHVPLAERLRPKSLDSYIGQKHLIGLGKPLRNAIETGSIPSMILWGPPGVGKTTLAQIISTTLNRPFYTLSAINSGVKDIREVIDKVKGGGMFGPGNAVLFIDEIHRFSKSQQDSLLGAVEKGLITLIGATTENPSFEVISALLSRCQVYVLEHHTKDDLVDLLSRAFKEDKSIVQSGAQLKEYEALIKISGGDARKLLNNLEVVIQALPRDQHEITNQVVENILSKSPIIYDKDGEQHYDIVSAFIKSIRGSDPNAAVYWMARMIEGGEDPKFIARRMLILASEDIGNANPTALVMANTCFDSIAKIGWPEGRIILSQCAIYLATSPKSNASYVAINEAQAIVRSTGNLPVPLHLRNAPTKLMKELGYGEDYAYSHNNQDKLHEQEFLPIEIKENCFYRPLNNKKEQELRNFLSTVWKGKYGY
ncbi:MAG: replication-associated recombination protein A [Flavobacteriales bacterium]|nr:replication-associated recombination protein A [Flavobacteriales bacterium]